MNEQHDPRRQPDQLEETLQDFYQTPAPPAEFVERLEQQLRARHSVLTQQHPAASAWPRLNPFRSLPMLKQHMRAFVSGVVGLVLLFVLIAGVLALFRSISQTTAINGTPTPGGPHLKSSATPRGTDTLPSTPDYMPTPSGPQIQLQGTGQLPDRFGRPQDGQIPLPMSVRIPRPNFPKQVALYSVRTGFETPSVELVRRWADQFGLKSVRVYRNDPRAVEDTGTSGAYIAQGADGRVVSVEGGRVNYTSQFYDLPSASGNNAPIDSMEAAAAAEAFLKSIPNLIVVDGDSPATIEQRVDPIPQTHPLGMLFGWRPVINGIPLLVNEGQILVDYNGQVRYASFAPMLLKPTGKALTPRPVETTLQELVNNDPAVVLNSLWEHTDKEAASEFQQLQRAPALAVGDEVVAYGDVLHWWALDGGSDQFILSAVGQEGTHDLVLEANGLDLAQSVFRRGAIVTGHLLGQIRPGLWRVQVNKIEQYPEGFSDLSELTGIIQRDPTGAWLEADSGQRYQLPAVPDDLPDGAYISAPGVFVKRDDQTLQLEWGKMTRFYESMHPTSDLASIWGQYRMSNSGEIFFSAGPMGITPTLPAWWAYEPGAEVVLEGDLAVSGYQTQKVSSSGGTTPASELAIFEATLLTHSPKDPAVDQFPVTLVGSQVNLDLLRINGFSAQVQGRLLTAEEIVARFPDLRPGSAAVVEIAHYERLHPAEVKAIFSGKIRMATVDGRQVAIISDTLSQREYVLSDSLTQLETLPRYERMVQHQQTLSTIGVTAPDWIYGDYPIVRGVESYSGEGEPTTAITQLRERLENPVQVLSIRPADSPTDVIFDQVELAYTPWGGDAINPIVIYLLTGHSSDKRYTLTYYLKAKP